MQCSISLSPLSLCFYRFILKPVITVSLMWTGPGSMPRPVCVLAKGPPLITTQPYVQYLHPPSSTSHVSNSQARKPSHHKWPNIYLILVIATASSPTLFNPSGWWRSSSHMHSTAPHLWFGVSVDLAGEGDWHAFKDFVVFELLVEGGYHSLAGRVFTVLHVVVRFLHRRALQTEFDLTDQALLEAGHFVLLHARERESGKEEWFRERLRQKYYTRFV